VTDLTGAKIASAQRISAIQRALKSIFETADDEEKPASARAPRARARA